MVSGLDAKILFHPTSDVYASPQGTSIYTRRVERGGRGDAWIKRKIGQIGKNRDRRASRECTYVYTIQWALDTLSTYTKPKTENRDKNVEAVDSTGEWREGGKKTRGSFQSV